VHTEVAAALRSRGIANALADSAGVREEQPPDGGGDLPVVYHFLNKHPEYKPLLASERETELGKSLAADVFSSHNFFTANAPLGKTPRDVAHAPAL
jgi:hypothetical protein